MTPLTNITELIAYKETIEVQKEALKASTVFAPIEKILILEIYDKQMKIVTGRIHHLQDLQDALKL